MASQPRLTPTETRYLREGLKRLGYKSYRGFLLSATWRATVRKYRKKACQWCGSKRRLCLHHLTYARLGAERAADLVTICEDCHRTEHGIRKRPRRRKKR
jgi:5-methylcytosine-specific restriction endonuclease McrA